MSRAAGLVRAGRLRRVAAVSTLRAVLALFASSRFNSLALAIDRYLLVGLVQIVTPSGFLSAKAKTIDSTKKRTIQFHSKPKVSMLPST